MYNVNIPDDLKFTQISDQSKITYTKYQIKTKVCEICKSGF